MNAVLALALLAPAAPPPEPDVKEAVRTGLKWLSEQQKADGHWEAANGLAVTPVTAYAGLALLMEGSTLTDGAYAPHLRKTVAWLEKNTDDTGKIANDNANEKFQYVYSHATALLLLACAYDVDEDTARRKRLAEQLNKAVAFAVSCQTVRGGWGTARPSRGTDFDDGLSTATILQALFAARRAGIVVPREATDKGVQYLVRSSNRDGGVIYSLSNGARPAGGDGQPMVSAAAVTGLVTSDGYRPAELAMWVKFSNRTAEQQFRLLRTTGIRTSQFYLARAAHAMGENGHRLLQPGADISEPVRWSASRALIFKAVKEAQGKDGSWAEPTFGPQHATALALMILQLDNDYLPALSR